MPSGHGRIGVWQKENPELAKQAQSKAGKKSVENKKKRKLLREYLSALLETETETGSYYDDITVALVKKAINGDVRAYETIRSTLGQDAPQQVELTSNTIEINITEDEK